MLWVGAARVAAAPLAPPDSVAVAPPDTLQSATEEVVVTASRREEAIERVPQPISVISGAQIRQLGAQRLDAVLAEQTGIVLTSDHGTGLQLQGIDDDYILILIDGEPLVGRTAGTLDLSRLTVENIERIEVLKGPASSLYGSEALGGVINIITRTPTAQRSVDLRARYGTNQTADLGLTTGWRHKGLGGQLSFNRFSSAGYDLAPETAGATVAPFANYTGALRLSSTLGSRWLAEVSLRGYREDQDLALADPAGAALTGAARVEEYNLHPSLRYLASGRLALRGHLYTTRYRTEEETRYAADGQPFDASFFEQGFTRPEVQADVTLTERHTVSVGVGGVYESVAATRYDATQRQQTHYLFAQSSWQPTERLTVVAGARYDAPNVYAPQLSPKLSVGYRLWPSVQVQGSVGLGFKAPDFRQLYLNFTNASAGYSVFGVREAVRLVSALDSAGQISGYFVPLSSFEETLAPERSVAVNVGGRYTHPAGRLRGSVNLFYNRIENLIETFVLAAKTNAQNVFSYRNLSEIITYGAEVDASYRLSATLRLQGGYQYLRTADLSVLEGLEAGTYFRRTDQGRDVRLERSDYFGLAGRSTHSANARLFYQAPTTGWEGSLRVLYRSRFGLGDTNGNAILDDYDTFAAGYATVNLNVGKTLWRHLTLQLGADNLLGYTDPAFLPTQPGRLVYLSALLRLERQASP
ncbi:MAG: TonB-dependent receptor [Bacteroidia bacterium]|nr:TonB-dependent receptor [Bacteroidia bacterium]